MWNQRDTCRFTFQCSFVAAKLSICVLYDPAIPFPNRDPKDVYTCMPPKTYTHIHTVHIYTHIYTHKHTCITNDVRLSINKCLQ